ncbi:MAG: ATP synthase F0 subunit B [Bdellovibrionales bacterium]|nr:ATP synthase F0 subunit B [Bdellovibrionales bacterium]
MKPVYAKTASFVAAAIWASSASVAHAASAHGGHATIDTLLHPAVNFILFAIAAVYLFGKYVRPLLVQRSIEVRDRLSEVQQLVAKAENELELLEVRLADIDGEKESMLQRYAAEGAGMEQSILDSAERQSERIATDTERQIENELQQAQRELRAEAVRLAAERARNRIRSELSADQDKALRRQVVRELMLQENQ